VDQDQRPTDAVDLGVQRSAVDRNAQVSVTGAS
jgi:hypothetical protein